jgi:SAM-dependent methyltransferase
MNTDIEWEKWGKKDPYFATLVHEMFRSKNLTDKAKLEFFQSGRHWISYVLKVSRDHLDHDFSPKSALDFGCGPGRIVIPLAGIAEHVVGLDVSDSMLKEAHKNCEEYSVKNVTLLRSDDNLSALDGLFFDFIHSVIVFQHIPVERGRHIFVNLLNHLAEGGIGAIQFIYSKSEYDKSYGVPPVMNLKQRFIRQVLLVGSRINLKKLEPEMQMNPYNTNELMFLMQKAGIRDFHVEFTDHGGYLGIILYFQKPKSVYSPLDTTSY